MKQSTRENLKIIIQEMVDDIILGYADNEERIDEAIIEIIDTISEDKLR